MNVYLLHRDRDFDREAEPASHSQDLCQDLELERIFAAMAADDDYILEVSRQVLLAPLHDPESIRYRQAVLRDCIEHTEAVRELYALARDAIQAEKGIHAGLYRQSPESVLRRSLQVMEMFAEVLVKVRAVADRENGGFRSEGFGRFFGMIGSELDDQYLETVNDHLKRLRFSAGVMSSVGIGRAGRGNGFVLRKPPRQSWWQRHSPWGGSELSFQIDGRDESGMRALRELRSRMLNPAAGALARSSDHILAFFEMLAFELAFYLGSVSLFDRCQAKGEPTCFPEPATPEVPVLSFRGLYDVSLSHGVDGRVVGNDLEADRKPLLVVTGANQGGKSTFLRSLGQAQLMMQAGMVVGAETFRADVRDAVFTHFRREEDDGMEHGKLDEELARMSQLVDSISSGSLLLCNESFASTNELEGSEIAAQIVRALLETGVKVDYVTHMFDLARKLLLAESPGRLFLRAGREEDGSRSFVIRAGEPLPTSYGADIYRRIFGRDPAGADRPTEPVSSR